MSLMYMNEMYKEVNISSIWKGGIKKTGSKKEKKGTIISIHTSYFFTESKQEKVNVVFISDLKLPFLPRSFGQK